MNAAEATSPLTIEEGSVLVVSTTWPPMAAGAGRALSELVDGFPGAVDLIVPPGSVCRSGVSCTMVPWLRGALRAGGPLRVLSARHHLEAMLAAPAWILLRRRLPRLVVCSITLFVGLGAYLLNRVAGVPYLVYAQGEELAIPLRLGHHTWRFRLTARVLGAAAAVVSISRFTKDLVVDVYRVPPDRVELIPPSIDVREADLVSASRVAECRGRVLATHLLLAVGRLWQVRKGFDRAIESLAILRRRGYDVALTVAGPGDQAQLRAYAEACGVGGSVYFTGEISREDLLAWYAASDAFMLPVRTTADGDSEGFGLVFLEAGLFGKPVVGGDSAGVRDAVVAGETGLLVDGNDAREIAAAVSTLLDDPALARRMGEAGRKRAIKDFSGVNQRRQFAALVGRIASPTRGAQ